MRNVTFLADVNHSAREIRGRGSGSCGRVWTGRRGGQNPDFLVDVINGWPLILHPHQNGHSQKVWGCWIFTCFPSVSAGQSEWMGERMKDRHFRAMILFIILLFYYILSNCCCFRLSFSPTAEQGIHVPLTKHSGDAGLLYVHCARSGSLRYTEEGCRYVLLSCLSGKCLRRLTYTPLKRYQQIL